MLIHAWHPAQVSKERARRRAHRELQQAALREQRERARVRRARVARAHTAVNAPGRAVVGFVRDVWRPISGGQSGLLARRRRRRVVAMLVVVAAVNLGVWLLTSDVRTAVTAAALTLLVVPVIGRLLFSRR